VAAADGVRHVIRQGKGRLNLGGARFLHGLCQPATTRAVYL
jgi:hypothetical protein